MSRNVTRKRASRLAVTLMAALMAVTGFASVASAHQSDEHLGGIQIHDEADDDTSVRVVNDCDFWFSVHSFERQEGDYEVVADRGTADERVIANGSFVATAGAKGEVFHAFEVGPVNVTESYEDLRVHVMFADAHEHGAFSNSFTVNCGETPPSEQDPDCGFDLTAEALEDEKVRLTWTGGEAPEEIESIVINQFGEEEAIATLGPDAREFVVEGLEQGETYTFEVALVGSGLPQGHLDCTVEVTAIPFFPNPVVATLATIGVAGTVFALRRKA